ncbi:hypothetical protein PHYSODRAFT_524958 [Phytophthora sojae]|uniref:Macro domain-containing protein n=1 Tax=Phytophthora sojae (strain P6497) TaxID=1094619 RepID=G5A691_PHYSP|nr:hypothetical protein PHYSODRAFT_524958 [Phytophthora sojae]EGZ08846.1 hypothetical protein PHYSODRAFT_524958 [Phytophthora sojae]|eukprot:XP_009535479.1 hypothetical protein PHYSODRAFT_524958 [Phytophthora sojae]
MEIWAVEGIVHSILHFLDLASFDAVLSFLQDKPEFQGYLQDALLWSELSKVHFGGQRDMETNADADSDHGRTWDWTSRERACAELQAFLQSMDDLARFEEAVTIVEGDIQHIDNIDGKPLDGIAFPTNSGLVNPHTASAGAVFRRAGRGLDEFVGDQAFRDGLANGSRWLPVGSAVVTPAFEAGVSKLIHCVGPGVGTADCYELLRQTYENAMNRVVSENLQCVAMVSISTGNLGVPCVKGAQVALRTIQKFLAKRTWQGKLAVVCNDERVLRAFTDEKATVMQSFNVIPPLPKADAAAVWFSL